MKTYLAASVSQIETQKVAISELDQSLKAQTATNKDLSDRNAEMEGTIQKQEKASQANAKSLEELSAAKTKVEADLTQL